MPSSKFLYKNLVSLTSLYRGFFQVLFKQTFFAYAGSILVWTIHSTKTVSCVNFKYWPAYCSRSHTAHSSDILNFWFHFRISKHYLHNIIKILTEFSDEVKEQSEFLILMKFEKIHGFRFSAWKNAFVSNSRIGTILLRLNSLSVFKNLSHVRYLSRSS